MSYDAAGRYFGPRKRVKEGVFRDVHAGAKVGAIQGAHNTTKNAMIGSNLHPLYHTAGAVGGGVMGAARAVLPHLKRKLVRSR